ncbi:MAG: hypothetical protein R3249_02615 [Nitriliruptorales bacterium]|nr:hypothetical protein [Nitriliruptorales bacterium]
MNAARLRWTLALTFAAWMLFVPAAGAYVDGGSMSVVFQALIAFAAAVGVTLKVFWSRIVGLFRGSVDEDVSVAATDDVSDAS